MLGWAVGAVQRAQHTVGGHLVACCAPCWRCLMRNAKHQPRPAPCALSTPPDKFTKVDIDNLTFPAYYKVGACVASSFAVRQASSSTQQQQQHSGARCLVVLLKELRVVTVRKARGPRPSVILPAARGSPA